MEEKKGDTDNTYANTIENIPVHISQVVSGRKGYYCQGCEREMIAKKGLHLMHHFAHDPKDVQNKGKCTYSDETYRHKLAKEILQRIRQIKVPTLYKYPPPGVEGKPNKLRNAEFILAETVRIELTFFEDEAGYVSYGNNIDFEPGGNKFLFIKPDVTFFDENENPILLIEIVATHKITDEKLSRIRKLGINTIQITIPKDSPEEIENTFFKTTRTEWIYNYEQEKATYIRTAKGDSEDIPPLTDLQRRLLEIGESYECRAFQIRDLIRGLNKCLESQPYTNFERFLREELQRVERNTEGYRERLRSLQEQHEKSIQEEFRMEEKDVAGQEETANTDGRKLNEKSSDYEERYYRKRAEIEGIQREYRPDCEDEIERITGEFERLGTSASNFRGRSVEIKREETEFEQYVRDEISQIEKEEGRISDLITGIAGQRSGLSEKYRQLEEGIRAGFERETTANDEHSKQSIAKVTDEFERNRRDLLSAIEERDSKRFPGISRGYRDVLETWKRLATLAERKNDLRRMRKFKELFDTGAYKNQDEL